MSNPLRNRSWLAFSDDTPEDAARRRFLERFGYPPAEIHRHKGLLWLGPVEQEATNENHHR